MTLSPNDIEAIRRLLREELVTLERFDAFEASVWRRFDETDRRFDDLFKENETREQENLVIKHQIGELEKKVA